MSFWAVVVERLSLVLNCLKEHSLKVIDITWKKQRTSFERGTQKWPKVTKHRERENNEGRLLFLTVTNYKKAKKKLEDIFFHTRGHLNSKNWDFCFSPDSSLGLCHAECQWGSRWEISTFIHGLHGHESPPSPSSPPPLRRHRSPLRPPLLSTTQCHVLRRPPTPPPTRFQAFARYGYDGRKRRWQRLLRRGRFDGHQAQFVRTWYWSGCTP